LTYERPDGMTLRPDGWQGTEFSDLQTVQNLLKALLNSGIPVKQHHYNEVILSNRMWPITNQQFALHMVPIWPFFLYLFWLGLWSAENLIGLLKCIGFGLLTLYALGQCGLFCLLLYMQWVHVYGCLLNYVVAPNCNWFWSIM
jgi:hypothetical protein